MVEIPTLQSSQVDVIVEAYVKVCVNLIQRCAGDTMFSMSGTDRGPVPVSSGSICSSSSCNLSDLFLRSPAGW